MRYCMDCGADITNQVSKSKRCPGCAKLRERLLERQRKGYTGSYVDTWFTGPPAQCVGCKYLKRMACNYFFMTGRTRTSLHLGEQVDINNPCREREVANLAEVPVL